MPDVVRQVSDPKQRLGRYRLIATLGQGGMGTIHLGVAEGIGGFRKLFVIKELKHELTLNDEFLEMFLREARLAARLNHPNVVHTIEADHEDGRYYLAMDFLDGQPFNEVLWHSPRDPVAPLALRLSVVCQALAGLHHAHELRDYDGRALHVVHRDVSPANIFVGYDGQVKVLDFGIAKAGDMEGTRPGEFKGKISYAAPEQLRGFPADRRVDVFGAGVVLWEALAMRRLVQGKPSRRVFEARLLGTEPRIGQILPDLDPALAAICDRAMHADPEQRFGTAESFRVALQDYLDDQDLGLAPAPIAEFMQAKFAGARAALHRVIDAELHGTSEDPATGLVPLPSLAPAHPLSLRPSSLASRAEYPPVSLRRQRRLWRRIWATLAVASLAAAIVTRLNSAPPDPPASAAEPREAAREAPAAADVMPASPRATGSEPRISEPHAPAPRQDPAVEDGAAALGAADAAAHVPEPDVARTTARPEPRLDGRAARTRAPTGRGNATGVTPERSAQPRAEGAGSAPGGSRRDAAAASPEMLDLRSMPRRQQRELDLDNPFRK
jgi:serine/threonine protein kinase